MILNNEFHLDAPIGRVWSLIDELENIVSCMPGAAYEGRDGDDYMVNLKVKIGPITSHFKGTARFIEKAAPTHTAIIRGVGKDKGGKGAATATVTARLEALSADRTLVKVDTDLSMTGPFAQFGSGVISDIASLMLAQFTANLHREVLAHSSVGGIHAKGTTSPDIHQVVAEVGPTRENAAVNLGAVLTSVGLNYLQKVGVPLGCLLLGWIIGRSY